VEIACASTRFLPDGLIFTAAVLAAAVVHDAGMGSIIPTADRVPDFRAPEPSLERGRK
jgi:hypothetical protein